LHLISQNISKINTIIILRAIAALGVCFVHIQMFTGLKVNKILNLILVNGQQGVAVFFVISGFILPYSLYNKNYRIQDFFSFLLKRSVRVDPPYWTCILLLFILVPLPFSSSDFTLIILHILYLVPFVKSAHWYSDIFWTLSIEFQFYIILGLCYPVLMRLSHFLSILILISLSLLWIKHTERGIIISNFYLFTFGYIGFIAYTQLLNIRKISIILFLFTCLICFSKSIISGIVPAAVVAFVLFYRRPGKISVLNFLGEISYSLYLVHIPASFITIRALNHTVTKPELLFVLCLLISILFAYIFNILIEKPSLDLSKRIKFN